MLAAAVAVAAGTTGALRMAVTLPVLLLAPGYLLLQAVVVPPAKGAGLLRQLLACLGISPAVVGLLALSTAIVAGAFKPLVIVAAVTVGCLAFATIAIQRRRARLQTRAPNAKRTTARAVAPTPPGRNSAPLVAAASPAPSDAARAKSGTVRP